jgi:hypothetical protein
MYQRLTKLKSHQIKKIYCKIMRVKNTSLKKDKMISKLLLPLQKKKYSFNNIFTQIIRWWDPTKPDYNKLYKQIQDLPDDIQDNILNFLGIGEKDKGWYEPSISYYIYIRKKLEKYEKKYEWADVLFELSPDQSGDMFYLYYKDEDKYKNSWLYTQISLIGHYLSLIDYNPNSKKIPTIKEVLGHICAMRYDQNRAEPVGCDMWTTELPVYFNPSNTKYFCNYYSTILKKSSEDTCEMPFDYPAFVNLWKYFSKENKIKAFYEELNLIGV